MNKNLKYLQKIFFLLVMGFSLCAVQACSDDDDEDRVLDNGNLLISGHEAVDLGLSVKWATCNVGALSPKDCGDYYAWGETKKKSNYILDSYKWFDSEKREYKKYDKDKDGKRKTVLDPSDDAATLERGPKWRMPTVEEMKELVEECTWTWCDSVAGYKILGPSGNTIFLPAAGSCDGTNLLSCGSGGLYWSATLDEDKSHFAYGLYFGDDKFVCDSWYGRYYGHTVRPVTE